MANKIFTLGKLTSNFSLKQTYIYPSKVHGLVIKIIPVAVVNSRVWLKASLPM